MKNKFIRRQFKVLQEKRKEKSKKKSKKMLTEGRAGGNIYEHQARELGSVFEN